MVKEAAKKQSGGWARGENCAAGQSSQHLYEIHQSRFGNKVRGGYPRHQHEGEVCYGVA